MTTTDILGHLPAGSVVVGVDGSEDAHRAIVWAADQAAHEKRPLVLVHGSPRLGTSIYPGAEYMIMDSASLAAFAEAARVVLADSTDIATQVHPELRVSSVEVGTDPREALLRASTQAHLLVVGSRGRGRVASLLLGSVSAAIAARASCPVVVVRPPGGDSGARKGVLVGARFEPGSLPVIEHAFAHASLHRMPLSVTHCYFDTEGSQHPSTRAGTYRTDLDDLREDLAQSVAGLGEKFPDVQVDLDLRTGSFRHVLADAAGTHDLVVVGRRSGSRLDRAIGTWSTLSIVENAAGVVAVVPESS